MTEPTGGAGDLSGWVSVGGIIGAIAIGAWAVIRGRLGEASTAITQTRAEATDVFVEETRQNREALLSLKKLLLALKDLLSAEREILAAMREAVNRIVQTQENIARMMQEQRESEKALEDEAKMLSLIERREREHDRQQRESERERDIAKRLSRE